ncbi:putative cyclin-P1-1 [Iris pallida]|uniref:Cyclin-P1-1 n=1 Tax=Iris pallida TaxID=29817 RepID=A0AAX6H1D5_IRIPA|nr:putative cyclin-P1-1 [Iris pallida]
MEGTDDESSRPAPRVLSMVAHVLEEAGVAERAGGGGGGVPAGGGGGGWRGFCGSRAPSIGIGSYLERIHRLAGCSPSCFVVGFAFIDRAAHRRPGSMVASLNVHPPHPHQRPRRVQGPRRHAPKQCVLRKSWRS